ncbi:MAG: Abi family protein [Mycoplasmoidaceae bacterium]
MSDNKFGLNPPKSFREQLSILVNEHKLDINLSDLEEVRQAELILMNMNYYILKGYGIAGNLLSRNDKDGYEFKSGTKITTLYDFYLFDCELKNILLYAIGIIEKNLRVTIANHLCCKYNDPECNTTDICNNEENVKLFEDVKKRLNDDYNRHSVSNDVAAHFIKDKQGHFPIWVIIESFSFGDLFYFYVNLSDPDKFAIATKYNIDIPRLQNWMYAIKRVRNICCHFNRLYGKPLISLKNCKKLNVDETNSNTIIALVNVIKYLLSICDNDQSKLFSEKFDDLVKKYKFLNLSKLWNNKGDK